MVGIEILSSSLADHIVGLMNGLFFQQGHQGLQVRELAVSNRREWGWRKQQQQQQMPLQIKTSVANQEILYCLISLLVKSEPSFLDSPYRKRKHRWNWGVQWSLPPRKEDGEGGRKPRILVGTSTEAASELWRLLLSAQQRPSSFLKPIINWTKVTLCKIPEVWWWWEINHKPRKLTEL